MLYDLVAYGVHKYKLYFAFFDLWTFNFPKIRPQIEFCPKMGGPQIGRCTV